MLACNLLSCKNSLLLSLVGQHSTAHDVSNRHNARNVGLQVVVDDDSALFVDLHSSLFQSEFVSVGSAASGDQDVVGLQDLLLSSLHGLNSDFSVGAVVDSADDLVGSHDLDALLGEDLVEGFGDFLVEGGDDFVEVLHNDDVGAESLVDGSHFESDDSSSDDHEILGDLGEGEGASRTDDDLLIEGQSGEASGVAASGDDRLLDVDSFGLAVG